MQNYPSRNLSWKCAVVNYAEMEQFCKLVGYPYLLPFPSLHLPIFRQLARWPRNTCSDEVIMLLCIIGNAFRNSFLLFQKIFLTSCPLVIFFNLVFPQICVYFELGQIATQLLWPLWQSGWGSCYFHSHESQWNHAFELLLSNYFWGLKETVVT